MYANGNIEGIVARPRTLGFRVEIFPLGDYGGDAAGWWRRCAPGEFVVFFWDFRVKRTHMLLSGSKGSRWRDLSAYFRSTVVDRANFHGFFNVQLALEQMRRLGYRRPALVVPQLNNQISNNLWSGAFLDWQLQLPIRDRCEPHIPRSAEDCEEFYAWLDANQPDSLLVYKVPVRGSWRNAGFWFLMILELRTSIVPPTKWERPQELTGISPQLVRPRWIWSSRN